MTTNTPELLPCPFCGSPAKMFEWSCGGDTMIQCSNSDVIWPHGCPAHIEVCADRTDAIVMWNTRTNQGHDALAAKVEAAPDDGLVAALHEQCTEVARDMAGHVADQIFDVLKRHGLMMRTEAMATAMMAHAAMQVLRQACDQCSRAAEEDCTAEVVKLFTDLCPPAILTALRARPSGDVVDAACAMEQALEAVIDDLEDGDHLSAQQIAMNAGRKALSAFRKARLSTIKGEG